MLTYGTPAEPTTPLVGALRDAVTTSNGLLLLLRSRNVAPKAIAQLLPSLRDSFRTLLPSFELLCEALAGRASYEGTPLARIQVGGTPLPSSLLALRPLLDRQVQQFNAAIELGGQGTVNARARLALEQSMLEIGHCLSALLATFELWSDMLRPKATIDLVELLTLSRFGDQPPIPHRQAVSLKLVVDCQGCLLSAPPRGVLNWLALGAAVLGTPTPPRDFGLVLSATPDRACLSLAPIPGSSTHALSLQLPAVVPETEANLLDAVTLLGVSGRRTPEGLQFEWAPGPLVMTGVAH